MRMRNTGHANALFYFVTGTPHSGFHFKHCSGHIYQLIYVDVQKGKCKMQLYINQRRYYHSPSLVRIMYHLHTKHCNYDNAYYQLER